MQKIFHFIKLNFYFKKSAKIKKKNPSNVLTDFFKRIKKIEKIKFILIFFKVGEAFKNLDKPASLIRDRLDEQIRQLKALQADVDSHESGIQKMYQAAQEFVQSSKNVRESKKIESKVKEVQVKYQGLVKAVQTRGVFLDEISIGLGHFTGQVESFDDWYMEMIEVCYYFFT